MPKVHPFRQLTAKYSHATTNKYTWNQMVSGPTPWFVGTTTATAAIIQSPMSNMPS